MKNITREEKILCIALFSISVTYSIVLLNKNSVDLYNEIFNQRVFILLYVPIFLYDLLKIIQSTSLAEITIRYECIDKLVIARTKMILSVCLRISIFFVIISSLFLILSDINIIFQKKFWIINILSLFTQTVGWFLIGLMYLLLDQLFKNLKLAYVIEICILASIEYMVSPLLLGTLSSYVCPIWDIMYFYNFDIKLNYKTIYINLTIIISILIIYLYKYLLKSRDIGR